MKMAGKKIVFYFYFKSLQFEGVQLKKSEV